MPEVRITQEAIDTMDQMLKLINGGFQESIEQMIRYGGDLGAGEIWRGGRSNEFANLWADYSQQLRSMRESLDEMNHNIQDVGQAIIEAGGGLS